MKSKKMFYTVLSKLNTYIILLLAIVLFIVLFIPIPNPVKGIPDILPPITALSMSSTMFFLYLVGRVVAKHFDNKFKEILINDPDINVELFHPYLSGKTMIQFRESRGALYAISMICPYITNRSATYRKWFHSYDFRNNARLIDIIISAGFVFSLFILSITSAIVSLFILNIL